MALSEQARLHLDWVISTLGNGAEIGLDRLIAGEHDGWGHKDLGAEQAAEILGYMASRSEMDRVVPSTIYSWRKVSRPDEKAKSDGS